MKTNQLSPNADQTFFDKMQVKLNEVRKQFETSGLLLVRTANNCLIDAKNQPVPINLYLDLWFEGEVCILFSDTNVGKSILAVQIAQSIAYDLNKTILYFDFELSDKQFEARYSLNYTSHFSFSDNFFRISVNPDGIDFESFDKKINQEIEQSIVHTNAKIIIIDNITFLRTQIETSKEALPLMKFLIQLKKKYSLSILVLAHTPKRDSSKIITINDLGGSKMISNFADSIFTIGVSAQDKSLRYIKQLKSRNTEIIYDANNIILCSITKPFNYLSFEIIDFDKERNHLTEMELEDDSKDIAIIELRKQNKDLSIRKIAQQLNVSNSKVFRVLKKEGL